MSIVERQKRGSTAAAIHRLYPATKTFWNINELVQQAGLRGLPTTAPSILDALHAGRGPKVYGTVGVVIAIRPVDGDKWITAELERRGRMKPTRWQRQNGIDEKNFASL